MTPGEIVTFVVACMTALGLVLSWGKYSRDGIEQRAQLEANLKNEIKDVKDAINNPQHGLSAINRKLEDQALNCAKTSTSLKERVGTLEKSLSK